MSPPLISIITINYNQSKVTCEFLASLTILTYPNYEVIVIDNASNEDLGSEMISKFPFINLYRTENNLGFTGGNNIGMKLAKGDFFLIINNDTEIVKSDFLERLIQPFYDDASIGMVSPKIHYFDRPGTIQFAGYNKINPFTGRNSQIGDGEQDNGQYDKSGYTHYANGAAMLVKREVAERVGIFMDKFFLCYEELDWSAQTIKNGYNIFYQAETHLLHKESITIGKISALKTYYNNRNRILFMRRNSNSLEKICFFCYYTLLTIPKNIITFLLKFQFNHLASFMSGIGWNIKSFITFENIHIQTNLEDVSLQTLKDHNKLCVE